MHYWALCLTNLSGTASYTWPSFQMVFKLYIRFEDPFISTSALDENGVLQREACDLNTWQKCKSTQKPNKGVQEAWMPLLLNSGLKRPGYQPQESVVKHRLWVHHISLKSPLIACRPTCIWIWWPEGYFSKKKGPRSIKREATLFPDEVQILIHCRKNYLQHLQQGL